MDFTGGVTILEEIEHARFEVHGSRLLVHKGSRGASSADILELSQSKFSMRGTTPGPSDGGVTFEAVLVPTK